MATIKEQLFSEVAESEPSSINKVTVVGIGQVGMACAFSILTQVYFFFLLFFVLKKDNFLYRHNFDLQFNFIQKFVECFK